MSGSSRSATAVHMTSVRMAGPATYTPAHIPAGSDKPMSQRARFNVYQNNGDVQHTFPCTVWGKLADTVARGGATGKELHITDAELRSYRGKVFVPNGQGGRVPFQMADGTFLMQTKHNVLVRRFIFGNDSDKTVLDEIQRGIRPQFWNSPGHPDEIAWKNIRNQRNAVQFDPNQQYFGTATVEIPQGCQLVDPNTKGAGTGQVQGNQMGSYGGGQPAQQYTQYAGNPQNVQQGFQAAQPQQMQSPAQPQMGGFQPNTGGNNQQYGMPQQVQVNGQNMGYAAPRMAPMQGYQAPASGGFQPPTQPAVQQSGYQAPMAAGGAY